MRRIGSRAVSWVVVAAVTAMLSPVSMSFAAVANDEVTSVKLKEADGTSGQNTNSGSGVKTGHIQDGAVTSTKIGAGAITNAKMGVSAVATTNIVDGAVTDAKITGKISTSKLNVGTVTDTVAAGDHNHESIYQKKYDRVYVVAEIGGDFTDLNLAVGSIPTGTNANYLIKVMPGNHHGTVYINNRNNITIEGSGQSSTSFGDGRGQNGLQAFVVQGSSNITISNMKISDSHEGVLAQNSANIIVENCRVSNNTNGIYFQNCTGGKITNNDVSDNYNGALLQASNPIFTNNTVERNDVGLTIISASTPIISYNTITNNASLDVHIDDGTSYPPFPISSPKISFNTFNTFGGLPSYMGLYNVTTSGTPAPTNPM